MSIKFLQSVTKSGLLLGVAVSLALLSVSAQARAPLEQRRFEANLVLSIDSDFPDPFVLRDESGYFALSTGANGQHIQVATSKDLVSWQRLPDALPDVPAWASKDSHFTWAPSVLKRASTYVLYYAARDRESGFQCISRALSQKPQGPYLDASSRPLICQTSGTDAHCGSIDPSPFVDRDGTAYLYWKSDDNCAECRTAPRVWVQRLTEDGTELTGAPSAILTMDQAWESTIVEGPSMIVDAGMYFLFYSANAYESAAYAIGYANCESPIGPCKKVTTREPWLKSKGNILGPGGQEFFNDGNGQTYIAYHAWTAPNASYERGGARALHIDRLAFSAGIPLILGPH